MGTKDLGLCSAASQVTQLDVFDKLSYSIKSSTLKGGENCSYVCKHFPQSPNDMPKVTNFGRFFIFPVKVSAS